MEPFRSMILVAPDHIESRTGRLLEKRTAFEQHAISGKYFFQSGDIVYSKIRPYLRKAILANFQGLCSADMYPLTPAQDVSPYFITSVLLSHRFSVFAETVSVRSGIPKINRDELSEFNVALPPLSEQEAIAEALSDADTLIEALEQLIAKKHQVKQGAMQELLTGKRRLSGFTGEWKQTPIGNEIDLLTGFPFPSIQYSQSGIRLLRDSNIKRGQTDWPDDITQYWAEVTSDLAIYSLREGDLVIAMDGSLVGKSYARLSKKDLPALLLQRVARIRSKSIDIGYW